jgi:hypothetical protein
MHNLARVSQRAHVVAVLSTGVISRAEADSSEGGQSQSNPGVEPKPYQVPNEHAAMNTLTANRIGKAFIVFSKFGERHDR